MKSPRKLTLLTILIGIGLVCVPAQAGRGPGWSGAGWGCAGAGAGPLASIPVGQLNEIETDNLLQIREEEKLARDVYLTLGMRWDVPIFDNIAGAEQRHMDAVARLLTRYDLQDPVGEDEVGVFTSAEMQGLYDELVDRGEGSIEEAFLVGATVEDMDIFDLERMASETEKEDLHLVFGHLTQASHNHLRAFSAHLDGFGLDYDARYLSQEQITAILEADQGPCGPCGHHRGWGAGWRGGRGHGGPGNRVTTVSPEDE